MCKLEVEKCWQFVDSEGHEQSLKKFRQLKLNGQQKENPENFQYFATFISSGRRDRLSKKICWSRVLPIVMWARRFKIIFYA